MKVLGGRVNTHIGDLNLLFSMALALEVALDNIRSDPEKIAIHELLSVVKCLRGSKEEMTKAFN